MYGSGSYAATLVFTAAAPVRSSNGGDVVLSDIAPLKLNNAFTNSDSFLVSGTSELTVTGAFGNSGTLISTPTSTTAAAA